MSITARMTMKISTASSLWLRNGRQLLCCFIPSLCSVECRLLSFSLSTEHAHVLLSGTYTKRARSFTSAVRATHLDLFFNEQARELHTMLIKKMPSSWSEPLCN
jgi:hypothetical protein